MVLTLGLTIDLLVCFEVLLELIPAVDLICTHLAGITLRIITAIQGSHQTRCLATVIRQLLFIMDTADLIQALWLAQPTQILLRFRMLEVLHYKSSALLPLSR